MYRQGDVLIVPMTGDVPEWADEQPREDGRVVLAHGEATGHAHAILEPGVRFFRDDGAGAGLLSVPGGGARVVHEEHAPIQLPPGLFRVIRQREFDAGMARRVAD